MVVQCLQGKSLLRPIISRSQAVASVTVQPRRLSGKRPSHVVCSLQPVSASANAPVAVPAPSCLPPAGVYQKVAALGAAKAQLPVAKTLVLSLIAGFYISLGALTMLSVGGSAPALAASDPGLHRLLLGVMGLPLGLLLVLLCGAELFTGNTMILTVALFEKKATFAQLVKNWTISYFGNLAGAMLTIKLLALTGLALVGPAAVKVATAKTSLTFTQAFTRGILANWMVCLAVWQATASDDLAGKFLAIVMTIAAFVSMGFEHSVANMFIIPMGIACGAPFNFMHFVNANLIPVTLGNIAGGALFCAAPYAFVFGGNTTPSKTTAAQAVQS